MANYVIKKSLPPSQAITCSELDDMTFNFGEGDSDAETLNLVFFGASGGLEWNLYSQASN